MRKNIIFEAVEAFISQYKGEKIVIYGGGRVGELLYYSLDAYQLKVAYFVDGNREKQETYIDKVEVRSPYDLLDEDSDNLIVLIGLNDYEQPKQFLEENGIRYSLVDTAHMNKKADLLDPFLGYSRADDVAGFKIIGEENAEIKIVTLGGSNTDYSYGGFNSWPYYLYQNYVQDGVGCRIYNGGIMGYYSGQELLKLLRDGLGMCPDIVISYSGLNDSHGFSRANNYSLISCYLEDTFSGEGGGVSISGKKLDFGLTQKINDVDNWLKNMRIMHAICQEFNISFYSFLQPTLLYRVGSYMMSEKEKQLFDKFNINRGRPINKSRVRDFYIDLLEKIKDYSYIFDLTAIFDNHSGIFFDSSHVSEVGNQIIADYIYKYIQH